MQHDENVEKLLGNVCTNDFEATLGPSVEQCTKLGVIVDFDGTLAYLARTPELAIIPPETKKILERFAHMNDVHVAIISGRQVSRQQCCCCFINQLDLTHFETRSRISSARSASRA